MFFHLVPKQQVVIIYRKYILEVGKQIQDYLYISNVKICLNFVSLCFFTIKWF